jgi:AraC-like DNA-binding protein
MKRKTPESIRIIDPVDMPYIQVVYGTNVTNEFSRHAHHRFCVGSVSKGARVFLEAGSSTIIPENAVFAVNADTAHTCKPQCREGHDYFAFCIDTEKIREVASQISDKAQDVPRVRSVLLCDAQLASEAHEMFFLLCRDSPFLQRQSAFISMISRLIIRHGDSSPTFRRTGPQPGAINRVRDFIEAHFAESISLEELSRTACLSPFHFHRLFLKNTGVSPHEYLVRSRIRKATELILQGHYLAGVAAETGFADQSHFTRAFKRIIGVTPGRYLQLNGKRNIGS